MSCPNLLKDGHLLKKGENQQHRNRFLRISNEFVWKIWIGAHIIVEVMNWAGQICPFHFNMQTICLL